LVSISAEQALLPTTMAGSYPRTRALSAYGAEPWRLVENWLDLDLLAQSESVFALSNGHIGLRGNLDEGDPHGRLGTYLNSFYEVRPLPYAEPVYGFPATGQTVINVTDGKIIRLLVDDEPFDIRYGSLHSHKRVLDMRAGTLTRQVDWSSPAGDRIRLTSVRMVSLRQRAIAAISYTVEPVEKTLRLVVQSELVANEELPEVGKDPRLSAVLHSPLVSEDHQIYDGRAARVVLVHKARASGLRMAAAISHEISGPEKLRTGTESFPDLGRTFATAEVAPGEQLRIVKYLGYGWSSQRSKPALIDQVVAALAAARLTGWDGLLAEQREYLDEFWDGADVEVGWDAEIQQAVRFGLFHILQAGYHVSGSCPGCGAVMLVIAAITPGALTAGPARRLRGAVSRPGRERPQAAGDHAPPGGPVTAIGREGASAL
jgi:alpha,alpha-trehalose phosphorylase